MNISAARTGLRFLALTLVAGAGSGWAAPYTATQGRATFEHRVLIVNVKGTVEGVTASVQLDPDDLAATRGQVSVPLANLRTGIGLRDDHARGESALNTARFPNAVFVLGSLTGGKLTEGQTLSTTASGQFTLRGVTRTISVPVKATLAGGQVRVATQFRFNPHDFGVNYAGSSDSASVDVNFTLTPGS